MKPAQHQSNQNRHIHLPRQRDREGGRLRRQIGAHQGTRAHGGEQLKGRHGERGIRGRGQPSKGHRMEQKQGVE